MENIKTYEIFTTTHSTIEQALNVIEAIEKAGNPYDLIRVQIADTPLPSGQVAVKSKELFEWVKASVGGKLNLPKEEFKVYPLRLDGNNYQTALFQSGKFSGFHPIHYNELEWLSPISQPVTVIGGAQFLSTFMEIWDEAKEGNYSADKWQQLYFSLWQSQPVKEDLFKDAVLNDLTSMPDKEFESHIEEAGKILGKSIDYTKPLLLEMFPDNKPKHWALVDRITGKVLWGDEVKEQVEQACPHCDISPVRCKSCGEVI